MQPLDLISTAKLLVSSHKGKPSQASLRRATSTAYYALFHKLAKSGADLLIGGQNAERSQSAWKQTYRALEHKVAASQCKNKDIMAKFPKSIEDFATAFRTMQDKRHSADYDPHVRFTKSQVILDIAQAEQVIKDFESAKTKDRRAFCAFVLFKTR